MKKLASLFLMLALVPSLCACSAGAKPATVTATQTPAATEAPEVVVFTDANLEDAVRTAMNRPDGDITVPEAQAVTVLDLRNADWDAMNAEDGGIKDLSDLKYFPNLTELHLDFNSIHDFTPLSALKNLNILSFNAVQVNDVTPLKSLTNMVNICFDWCYGPDEEFKGYPNIDFVKSMPNLEIFEAKKVGLIDISPLVGLPKLWSVAITDNLITDISPLAQIKTLREFQIGSNPIADYSVLEPYHDVFPNLYSDFKPDVDLK